MRYLSISGVMMASVLCGCVPTSSDDASDEVFELGAGVAVAAFELAAPSAEIFVLHGTMPVPPGTWPDPSGLVPFVVMDSTGKVVSAQIEIVSRYATAEDGADVVEILAEVHRPPGAQPGDRITYEVQSAPHPSSASASSPDDPSGVTPGALAATAPQTLQELVADTSNLRISARDVFGNEYESHPLANWPESNPRILRWGIYQLQLGIFDTMMPVVEVAGAQGTLPHGLGVHSYMSVRKASAVLQYDLRFSNAGDGNNTSSSVDDPLGKMYFDSLDFEVPNGWVVMQDVEDPGFGWTGERDGKQVYSIVKPQGTGELHMMPSQGQFHRRLVIVKAGQEEAGRRILDQEGLAFCVPEQGAQAGGDYYSWQHGDLGRYFPQAHALPNLEYVGLESLRTELKDEMDGMRGFLKSGLGSDSGAVVSPRLGWSHPSGVSYGGMTGGFEIHLYDGVRTAGAASVNGYLHLMDRFRMTNDRMPVALYKETGAPSRVADWVVGTGPDAFVPFTYYNGKMNGSSDPFGYGDAPTFQVDYVQAHGLAPSYESALEEYQAHDRQHMVRYIGAVKALAWLGNDWLAKDALLMVAENFHMEFHENYNSEGKSVQGTGLLAAMESVALNPGVGFEIGRGEGWGLEATAAAYALSQSEVWRSETREWIDIVVDMVFDGQADCSGIVGSKTSKWLGGNYRVRSSIEMSILESALRSLSVRMYDSVDHARHAMLQDVLHDSFYGLIGDLSWGAGNAGPWSHLAVGPLDTFNSPPFCVGDDLPLDGHDQYLENYQCWSSLAYAFEMTGNTQFLEAARLMTSGGSLTASLQAQGVKNLANRAALLATVQMIGD